MGRIFFSVCGGVLALGLMAAAPLADVRGQGEQTKATRDLTQAVEGLSEQISQAADDGASSRHKDPCEAGVEDRSSELCAQWMAADAAREAARWSFWSTVVGLIGVWGLAWNISQGRAALARARDANVIARRQFEAGFHPQLAIEMFGPINQDADALAHEDGPDRLVPVRAAVKVTNIGTVPTTLTGFEICCIDTTIGMQSVELYHFLAPQKHVWLHPQAGVLLDDIVGAGPSAVGIILFSRERFRELRMRPPEIYGGVHHTDQLGKMRVRGFGFNPGQWFAQGPFPYSGGETLNYDQDNEGKE